MEHFAGQSYRQVPLLHPVVWEKERVRTLSFACDDISVKTIGRALPCFNLGIGVVNN